MTRSTCAPRRALAGLRVPALALAAVALAACFGSKANAPHVSQEHQYVQKLEQRCTNGELDRCAEFGDRLLDGDAVAQDTKRGIAILGSACSGAEAQACRRLATAYLEGTGVEKKPKRALQLYEKSCSLGNHRACHESGYHHKRGDIMNPDLTVAAERFATACDKGDVLDACLALAEMHENGEGVPKDIAKARALMQKACDAGQKGVCEQMARLPAE